MSELSYLAFISAGGSGSRLLPLTNTYAKPAIPVDMIEDRIDPMIGFPIRAVAAFATEVLVSTYHLEDTVKNAVGSVAAGLDIRPRLVDDKGLIHIGGSLLRHRKYLEDSDSDGVIVVPGDTFITSEAIRGAAKKFEQVKPEVTFFGTKQTDGHDVFAVNRTGRLLDRAAPVGVGSNLGSLGIYIFNKEWLLQRLDKLPHRPSGYYDPRTDLIFGSELPCPEIDFYDTDGHAPITDLGSMERLHDHITTKARRLDENNSLVLAGAAVAPDCDVLNSVVYPGASILSGSVVINAIVCPGSIVEPDSKPKTFGSVVVYS